MNTMNIEWKTIMPPAELFDFVESFWMVVNHSEEKHDIVLLPDGRFDIIFSYSSDEPYRTMLMGLNTEADKNSITAGRRMFAVSFKLLAIEYILDLKAAFLLNKAHLLPLDFWGITKEDLVSFEQFCEKASAKMVCLIKPDVDKRKQKLFELIYSSNGTLTVKELSEKVHWSSRQINRYFNEHFGLSLKTYCNILRFKGSLKHIKKGKLFPELNYTDQNHFIKEVKKFSGTVPKELFKNTNDRFILLSAMPK